MVEWTPEATEYLDGYLKQVAALARHQEEDVDEIVQDLRDHVVQEAEAASETMITTDRLRRVLAVIGTPEQVSGFESALVGNGEGAATLRGAVDELKRSASAPTPAAGAPHDRPAKRAMGFVRAFLIAACCLLIGYGIGWLQTRHRLERAYDARAIGEVYAMQTVRHLQELEEQFRGAEYIDEDGDGTADYGTLMELMERFDETRVHMNNLSKWGYTLDMHVTPSGVEGGPGFECIAAAYREDTGQTVSFRGSHTGSIGRFLTDGAPSGAPTLPAGQKMQVLP
ncbi:MAG: hypothetical protein JXR94_07535 [Candidatus Hydrogenedentes bacterium]|nr:hypothetical protein [Candidatus Hydrogenedentota bacterium]